MFILAYITSFSCLYSPVLTCFLLVFYYKNVIAQCFATCVHMANNKAFTLNVSTVNLALLECTVRLKRSRKHLTNKSSL